MPEEGPYEIMPYKEIVKLKKELEELQKKAGEAPSRELLKSIDNLTKNMDSMLGLFKSAAEEMAIEEKAAPEVNLDPVIEKLDGISGKMDELIGKIDEITPENKAIAEGIIALSDMVTEKFEDLSKAVKGPAKPEPKPPGLPSIARGGPIPPGAPPGPIPPGGPPGALPLGPPGGIEGTISAGGPAPSRLPKGPVPPRGPPLGPPGVPPLGPPGGPPLGPPGGPPGAPPKKKPLFTFGKK